MKELQAKYDHLKVEDSKIYQNWVEKGYFNAIGEKSGKDPFCIVIPPPNVTGKLHLGHAWDVTLQDIISRYQRMQGKDMLWLAGMDHAGIATQAKVDARLKEQGTNRYEIGREKFLDKAWEWKEEYASFIRTQWAKMGVSLDYSRERFTLDDQLSQAVKKVFVDLYNEGLIYQGYRIINWDPQAKTALSNIEVIHKETQGHFYTFKYQIVETGKIIEVATTRPETMFGEVCVVVNPNDKQYLDVIGLHVINPANGDVLPIIADDYIEIGFGTGAMKCTPAHDPNDFLIGERHGLEKPICMNEDGTMNELAKEFNGMDRFECRKALVEKIEKEGNLVKIEEHIHQVGYSERTNCIVEPYLSKQWFVKMKPLADDVLKHQKDNTGINFYPPRFENTFTQWLDNIEDWCISRQLWWGHRIPAYYHNVTGEIVVGDAPKDIENYHQDEDVLDTWFSSALWPFSTLGWPNDSADFNRFFPTSCLVTGYDIIFFWVARMAFQARHFTDNVPFKDCLIHGLVRDEQGRKMSKSLGNGIDPMEIIEKYGVDALRYFLTTNSTPGQDLRYSEEKVKSSANFINKIYNSAKFVQMYLDKDFDYAQIDLNCGDFIDKWILSRLDEVIVNVNNNMDKYEFSLVGNELYNFIWDDFCSNYIELCKPTLFSDDEDAKKVTCATLLHCMISITKLIHPFMPFISEEIFTSLSNEESICISKWPTVLNIDDKQAIAKVKQLLSMIDAVRNIKVQYNLKPSQMINVNILDKDNQVLVVSNDIKAIIEKMVKAQIIDEPLDGECVVNPLYEGSLSVLLNDILDVKAELERLEKELGIIDNEIKRATNMLSNEKFVSKAPASKIEEEKNKLLKYQENREVIIRQINNLKNKC
ncbi:MAG: valine--tRNA ligase [Erysipelotrichaceae bacterium]